MNAKSEAARERGSEAGPGRVRTFRDLIAWQRSIELAERLYVHTRSLPPEERFGLQLQMRRAAVSISSNIAEGHARESRADYIRFLRIARGSLAELDSQLELAVRLRMLEPDAEFRDLLNETGRVLRALVKGLE
jgi:four helix bundle protein